MIDKISQHFRSVFRVHDLWMELYGIEMLCRILHCRNRADRCACCCVKSCGQFADVVCVAHPANILSRNAVKQKSGFVRDVDFCPSIFARGRSFDASAAEMCHQLRTVADPEDRNPQGKQFLWCGDGFLAIDAVRTARQNNAAWGKSTNTVYGQRMWMDFTIDMILSYASCDKLVILSAEIQHQNHFRGFGSVHHGSPFLSTLLHLP